MTDQRKRKRKWKSMTDQDVLALLDSGKYDVDLDTGIVTNHRGVELKPFTNRTTSPHLFVYLFNNGDTRRGIAVHRLVWMKATMSVIPEGWHIHHEDQDPTNNSFQNLFCLHPLDHHKIHRSWNNQPEEEVPF